MPTRALDLARGLAFAAALLAAGDAWAGRKTTLPLYLDNYARLAPELLSRAQAHVSRIYAAAGVRIAWIEDEVGRSGSVGARQLRVLLLCSEMSARKIDFDQVPGDVLAQAAHGAGRAYIFTGRVLSESERRRRDAALVLGRVIAHEVGHLLLRRRGHSDRGIMRSSLDLESRSAGAFTAEDGAEIRLALNDGA